jgi:hypothetical protein
MKTLYLKRQINNGIRFVMVYNDKKGTNLKAIFNSTITSLPNKKRKILTLNCFKFNIQWIN